LAIGGTTLTATASGGTLDEIVWNDGSAWAGGGGTSGRYDPPSWQESLVDANGRGYPDLALLADSSTGYAVSYCPRPDECGWTALGGTSAATPLAAGALALVNQAREARGLGRVGLVAPALYAAAGSGEAVARDITEGGIFVATVTLLPIGTSVKLELGTESGPPVVVEGDIAWVSDDKDGMGIRFTHLDDAATAAIEEFMQKRAPLLRTE